MSYWVYLLLTFLMLYSSNGFIVNCFVYYNLYYCLLLFYFRLTFFLIWYYTCVVIYFSGISFKYCHMRFILYWLFFWCGLIGVLAFVFVPKYYIYCLLWFVYMFTFFFFFVVLLVCNHLFFWCNSIYLCSYVVYSCILFIFLSYVVLFLCGNICFHVYLRFMFLYGLSYYWPF